MTTPEQRARNFPQRCFNSEEFAYLITRPEFIQATQRVLTMDDALIAVQLGGELIRETWERNDYRTSEFTLRKRNTPGEPASVTHNSVSTARP
jgi:hypothetical protein